MSESAIDAAGNLLARKVGLRLDAAMRGRMERCLREGASGYGQDVTEYVQRLDTDEEALQAFLNLITVQETWFFRDPAQFDALKEHVVPRLRSPVTVWSAGCANGQEAYSLSMVLDEGNLAEWKVVATDLSTQAVERTRAGRYAQRELRGLSHDRINRYLVPEGNSWLVGPRLRQSMTVWRHNLITDAPPFPHHEAHVIFCRNVLIYLRRDEALTFLRRVYEWLPPGGYLFLGYSESLWQVTDLFELVRLGEAFVYRRPSDKAVAPRRDPEERAAPKLLGRLKSKVGPTKEPPPARKQVPAGPVEEEGDLATRPELVASGEAALSAGDLPTAIGAFRKAVYLKPDDPIAHFYLGLSLDAGGDRTAAQRAFRAARRALDQSDTAALEAVLEGYRVSELASLLDAKLADAR